MNVYSGHPNEYRIISFFLMVTFFDLNIVKHIAV